MGMAKNGNGKTMENTSYIAVARQATLRRQLEMIANNLANMNTAGFKGENMMFVDHLVRSRGGERMLPEQMHFVRDLSSYRNFDEGPIEATSNPLDVAIRGEGYFVVETPEGARYTRTGRFHFDEQGRMVTAHGYPVLSDAGQPFVFSGSESSIDIARDGTVSADDDVMGRLRIVTFENEHQLRETYGGLYQSDAPAEDSDNPEVVQSALEGSNVNGIFEITRMIEVQRSYDSARKLVEAEDERIKKAIGELAKVAA